MMGENFELEEDAKRIESAGYLLRITIPQQMQGHHKKSPSLRRGFLEVN